MLYVMHTYYGSEYHLLIYCQLSISFIVHCLLQRYYILYIIYSIQYTGYMPYASCCVKQAIIIIIVWLNIPYIGLVLFRLCYSHLMLVYIWIDTHPLEQLTPFRLFYFSYLHNLFVYLFTVFDSVYFRINAKLLFEGKS